MSMSWASTEPRDPSLEPIVYAIFSDAKERRGQAHSTHSERLGSFKTAKLAVHKARRFRCCWLPGVRGSFV